MIVYIAMLIISIQLQEGFSLKRVIKASTHEEFDVTTWSPHDEWSKQLGVTSQEAYSLVDFIFWIQEAKKKGIPIDELADYIYSRTFDNPRSQFSGSTAKKWYARNYDDVCNIIDRCTSTEEVARVARAARRDFDAWRDKLYEWKTSKVHKACEGGELGLDESSKYDWETH